MRKYFLLALISLASCSDSNESVRATLCYPMNNDAQIFANELSKLSIHHEFIESEKCIYGGHDLYSRKEEVELVAFGPSPPLGLSTSYRDNNSQFIHLLNSNGIETTVSVYRGLEYISWSYEDLERAEELLEFEPWLKDQMREARNNANN